MAKTSKKKTRYECTGCGAQHAQWMGRCPTCGEWNTLEEHRPAPSATSRQRTGGARPVAIGEVRSEDAARLPTGIGELDRALGGGPVRGGVVLLGGDPGIGKSTLLLQALASMHACGAEVLYVTGEESASQVAMRARRIGGPGMPGVKILATTELADAEEALSSSKPQVAVIDSIQTLRAAIAAAPGSVSQLREVASVLIDLAKRHGIALFLIGHVTKEGTIAGPKVLEHLVDTVLSFEGDRSHAFRMVRATKNRFGPAQEMGVFEMDREGLREVPDPSTLFLAERPDQASGSVVVSTAEGSRPLLVELQALVAPCQYGAPRRVVSGLDANRLNILLAVLDRRAGLRVLDRDVFASVAGGARIDERAADLAITLAVASSFRHRPLPASLVVFGEVGLAGELRAVPRPGPRIAEARKLGFEHVLLPRANAERLTPSEREGVELMTARTVGEAIERTLS